MRKTVIIFQSFQHGQLQISSVENLYLLRTFLYIHDFPKLAPYDIKIVKYSFGQHSFPFMLFCFLLVGFGGKYPRQSGHNGWNYSQVYWSERSVCLESCACHKGRSDSGDSKQISSNITISL